MKKEEAEVKIRALCHVWAREKSIPTDGSGNPSDIEFMIWLRNNGYGGLMEFRARGGPIAYISRWFDQEFKQTWKN